MKSNVLILLLTIVISQLTNTVTAQRTGWWNFNNPDNPTAAVEGFGQDLLLVGTHQIAAGPQANDFAAKIGVTRLIPGISESDAIINGTLTDTEKEIYKAVFYSRTATVTMINECESVKANAKKVQDMGIPQVPMLLFISDGSGGTGFDKETWRRIPKEYIAQADNAKYIELDCPHYVHDYEYKKISENIIQFLLNQ